MRCYYYCYQYFFGEQNIWDMSKFEIQIMRCTPDWDWIHGNKSIECSDDVITIGSTKIDVM